MNAKNPVIWARYGARLLSLMLGAVVTALMIKGASFAVLTSQAFLISLVVLVGLWAVHVAQGFADTGDVPAEPPAEAPVIIHEPVPVPTPPAPPVPAAAVNVIVPEAAIAAARETPPVEPPA